MVGMMESERDPFDRLAGGPRTGPGIGCPAADELASVAAGLATDIRRDSLLDHASRCDSCGATLRALIEDFSEESGPQTIESLRTAQPEWQREMAARMAQASGRKPPIPIRSWLAAAAAVIAAAGGGWFAWTTWFAANPERLLAEAYTQQRPFDFRVPGAAYAPVRQERGALGSSFTKPRPLLQAEDKIAGDLESHPDRAKSLQLRARAEMLEHDPERALATMQHALEQNPDDPALLAEIGMAYALRAQSRPDRAVDYAYAMDYLERSRRAKPNSRETVFNLALVYQQMNSVDDAIREWGEYLKLDPSGAWHDEAQHHLSDLNLKKKSGSKA
jgi:tetratricopeptide (TPR) repeat protein